MGNLLRIAFWLCLAFILVFVAMMYNDVRQGLVLAEFSGGLPESRIGQSDLMVFLVVFVAMAGAIASGLKVHDAWEDYSN